MEGRLKSQLLCGVGAVFAVAAGALAFVTPFAAVGAGLLAAITIAAPLLKVARTTDSALVEKLHTQAQQGRQLAIFERETGLLAHWYLMLRGAEECVRAQRYGRELTVVVVEPKSGPQEWATQHAITDWLGRHTRESDLVGYLGNGRFVAILTETEFPRSDGFITRLSSAVPAIEIGTAAFPTNGSSYAELLQRAEEMLRGTARMDDWSATAESAA